MSKIIMIIALFFPVLLLGQNRYWVASTTANWSGDNWSSTATGTPDGGGAPTGTEVAIFTSNATGNCNVDVTVSLERIDIQNGYTGTIDLQGNSFTIVGGGTSYFRTGTISDTPGTSSLSFNTTGILEFTGTTLNTSLTGVASAVRFNGGVFNDTVNIETNSSGTSYGLGGCTFNSFFKVKNSGTGWFLMGRNYPDVFNGNVELENTSSSRIRIAYTAAGTQINGNLTVSNTGGGIWFGENGGTTVLASNKSILLGASGFTAGDFRLVNFHQVGSTAQNLTLTGTARVYFDNAKFDANVSFTAPRIYLRNSLFSGTSSFEKTGANNDPSFGGNKFVGNCLLRNSGSNYFSTGHNSPDTCLANLTLENVSTSAMYFAYNTAGNFVGGDLTVAQNPVSGSGVNTYLAAGTVATLDVQGNLSVTNNGNASNQIVFVGDGGDVNISGNLNIVNAFSGTVNNADIRVANTQNSSVIIGGATTVTNAGSGLISRVYLGNEGDVTFNGTLTMDNNSPSSNSEIYLNRTGNSQNIYNQNIVVTSTNANSDGIWFGNSGGTGVLSAGKTITIGAGGFVAGSLYFRNFTQTGNTAHTLTLDAAGTATLYNYDSDWGGDVVFSAPRIYTRGTTYRRTAQLTKTGANSDYSSGGNTFMMNTVLTNSGSGYFLMGGAFADDFQGNLDLNNLGSNSLYIAYSSTGNSIAGDLTIVNSASGGYSMVNLCEASTSSITAIGGNVSVLSNGSASDLRTYIGNRGKITSIGGDLTVNNQPTGNYGRVYVSQADTCTINGNVIINNTGTATNQAIYMADRPTALVNVVGTTQVLNSGTNSTSRIYLGTYGSVNFNGTLSLKNTSSATFSEIYLNYYPPSANTYNDNITVESTQANCDGVWFGVGGGGGTLSAGKTITIGAGGFVAGTLYFRNFTQTGNTAHTLTLDAAGTATLYNYDSDWGGDVVFSAPRIYTRGTTYRRTAQLTKTGANNDYSAGGNTFMMNTVLNHSGSGYFVMGSGNPDDFQADLDVNNSGSSTFYLAYNSVGNSVAGNMNLTHSTTGGTTTLAVAYISSSSISIGGNVSILNTSSSSYGAVYLGANGKISSVGGNIDVENNSTGSTGYVYLASRDTLNLAGNLTIRNIGISNNEQVFVAPTTGSFVDIGGVTNVLNSGTGTTSVVYLGSQGSVTFNNDLKLSNNSQANNSQIRLSYYSSSQNLYKGNIVVESYDANCDGIEFGRNGGSGTLFANKTITVGPNGFIAGSLYLRNFTQVGTTPQNLNLLSSGTATLYNYDSDWGGNVNFSSPRIYTRGTTYRGTAYLEKTGANHDASVGGNTFVQNTELKNSGSGYFMMGNGSPDIFQANLVMNNVGTHYMYLAQNSAGNTIAGDLTVNHTTTSGNTGLYLSNGAVSTLSVGGNTIINNTATSTNSYIYVGVSGDMELQGNLTINNTAPSASTNSYITVANGNTSTVNVSGNTVLNNTGDATNNIIRLYMSGNGTMTGTLDVFNGSNTANVSETYIGANSASSATFNNTVTLNNFGGGTTKRITAGNSGDLTFNADVSVKNTATATNSICYFNAGAASSNIYNGNIVLESYGTNCDGIAFGSSGGTGVLANTKTVSIGANGFTDGRLMFRNFTQLGGTPQNITTTANSDMYYWNAVWNGNVNFVSPGQYLRSSTFNGTAYIEKTGAISSASYGDNTYNADVTFKTTGTGYFAPTYSYPSDHNGNVTYIKTGTGPMYPTYNTASTYAGDINFDFNTQVTFAAAGGGRVIMDGTGAQSINDIGTSPTVRFRRLRTNNTIGDVTLNVPIEITNNLDLVAGNIVTTSTNLITVLDNATATSASDNAFIDGPIQKRGNDTFTFPTGKNGVHRPIEISNPASASAMFKAEFFDTDPHLSGYNDALKDATLDHISNCEYWILDRTNTTNSVNVKLYYKNYSSANCSGVDNQAELAVARWDGTMWKDHGNGAFGGTTADGWVQTAGAVTSFSPFTLASTTTNNPLPIELILFEAVKKGTVVDLKWKTASELNNDFFTIERSADGINFEAIETIEGAGTSNVTLEYETTDFNPLKGLSYYRLKQTDFNGEFSYSDTKTVYFENGNELSLYPNPAKDILNIKGMKANDMLEVRSVEGKLIYSGNNITTLDVSKWSKGIYQVSVFHQNGEFEVLKFVKQ